MGARRDHALWRRALEETGRPDRVHALDHTGGERDGDAYSRITHFHPAPVIDDDVIAGMHETFALFEHGLGVTEGKALFAGIHKQRSLNLVHAESTQSGRVILTYQT